MNKKRGGFTLIELLAVVTLIALISIIAIPNILKSINDKKQEISDANMKLLASAADIYIQNHSNLYASTYEADGSTYCISIQELVNSDLLTTPFKDVSGNEIDYSMLLKATYNSGFNSFTYDNVLHTNSTCTETINFVSRPILTDNMIPVVYEGGVIKKADVNSKWYNYTNKNWANVVFVKELKSDVVGSKSRDEYKSAPAGTQILESDILAQFVWIPRFRYQLFESATETPINIVFENVSTVKSVGTATGQWLTHPAFTYNNKELSGIWVGKYNSSNSDGNIIIKSGNAWTGIDYNSANELVNSMTNFNNIYGLSGINTHMVRNSEWGAVTYLANSKYGINDDMDSSSTTTGNNTGIYNMVGNKEYVILDSNSVNDLGYSLMETNSWTDNSNTYKDNDNLYVTRGGSSIFNYDKSTISSINTTFRVSIINKDTSTDYKPKYIVSFDPNGGSVDTPSKEVTYGDPYGELPTPTRDGYTFKGWNGKNMFDEKSILMSINGATYENGHYIFTLLNANSKYGTTGEPIYIPGIKENTQYTFTITGYEENYNTQYGGLFFYFYYTNGTKNLLNTDSLTEKTWTTTTSQNKTFSTIGITYGSGGAYRAHISHIQLEEGTVATPYEPYYVTSDVLVTQDKNHTLKAIWEANS